MDALIAITGATGFVGRHVAAELARRGVALRALVRDPSRLDRHGGRVTPVAGDLADRAALAALVEGADAVVHVAGAIAATDPQAFAAVNVVGTRGVAEAAVAAGVARLVHVSSLAARHPALSGYCLTKRLAEAALAGAASGLSWTAVRPPAVYGPLDRASLPLIRQLSRRTAWVTGSPEQRLSLIHVADLARALADLALSRDAEGLVCDLDDGRAGGYGWADLAAAAAPAAGHQVAVRFVPVPLLRLAGSASGLYGRLSGRAQILTPGKVAELLHPDWVARDNRLELHSGWRPRIGFAEGYAATLAAYRDAGWLPAGRRPTTTRASHDNGGPA